VAGRHALQKEALPWWIFGVFGGLLAMWLGHEPLAAWLAQRTAAGALALDWEPWIIYVLCFIPGAIVGGLVGRLLIGLVNSAFSGFFHIFNRLFDATVAVYGQTVARLLRYSGVAITVY